MTWIPTTALFFVVWIAIFAQTQFRPLVNLLATPISILPALMVYAALTHSLVTVAILAVVAGLGVDALSAAPVGISILPLFAIAFGLHLRRHLILRDQTYAQFWLGLGAGIAAPLLTLILLNLGSVRLIQGPILIAQLIILAFLNGAICPVVFRFFDAIQRTFTYQPLAETSFRTDRQIKRGRL